MSVTIIIVLILAAILGSLWTANLNPPPAKYAQAHAYCTFNLAAFTIGTKAANTINVAVQLKDAHNQNIAQIANCEVYLSDNADGSTLTATATTSAIAVHTNGFILGTITSSKAVQVVCNGTGKFDLDIIQTASPVTYYMALLFPDGSIVVSGAITF